VLDWWTDRFGVDASVFADYTFWEKGTGKVWVVAGDEPSPCTVETLGILFMRTDRKHWKPTTNAAQRFGRHATQNVVELDPDRARRFVAGEDQELDWDGDWGFLIGAHDLAGRREPIGVGLYVYGELRSQIPKGRRREF
jgi:NOL1/NOP2/fmu family ribosome biogenesis protein